MEYTFLRVEVKSRLVGRVLDALPGVSVVDDLATDRGESDVRASDAGPTAADLAGGARDAPSGSDGEESALRKWGLLGVGAAFVALGVATMGIWWYRRRSDDDGGAETPPPTRPGDDPGRPFGRDAGTAAATADDRATGDESGDASPEGSASGTGADASADDDTTGTDAAVSPTPTERGPDETATRAGDPTTDDDGRGADPVGADDAVSRTVLDDGPDGVADVPAEAPPTEESPADRGSIDAAPLLGVAFLAVTGVVARRLSGAETGQR